MVKKQKEIWTFWLITILIVLLDYITKQIVYLKQPSVELLKFFSIIYVQNTGAGFGILRGYNIFLIIVSAFVAFFIIYYYKRIPQKRWPQIGFALILAGVIGNLIDRVMRGFVIDFMDFFIGGWHWPAFNIADIAIVAGVIMLIIYFWNK